MADLLEVIKTDRLDKRWWATGKLAAAQVDWLIAEVERLRAEVAGMQDHPPGIGDADIQRVFRERDAALARIRDLQALLRDIRESVYTARWGGGWGHWFRSSVAFPYEQLLAALGQQHDAVNNR